MISVIVPIYNVEHYLRQCIDSILCQTYRDLEVLLIDDGSQDKCGEICDEYAKKDNRIRVFHTKNFGLSAARNLGLRKAQGDFIGFVDSDDWIESNMYESLLRQIEKTGVDICNCGAWKEYQKSKYDYNVFDGFFVGAESLHAFFLGQISTVVWNKLFKRHCWTSICFPENHNYEDQATIYKILLKAHSVSCIPKQLYHYRMREGSIDHTSSMSNLEDYWNAIFERFLFINSISVFYDDQVIIDTTQKQIVCTALRTWDLFYCLPSKQRDYSFLRKVSFSVRNSLPPFGRSNWDLRLCISSFFVRHMNGVSFFILQTIKKFSRLFLNKKTKNLGVIHDTFFPPV